MAGGDSRVVQDLVMRSNGEPPARFVLAEDQRPSDVVCPPASAFPTIDLRRLRPGADGRADELAKLHSALESWGMFLVVGHGMSDEFIDEVREVGKTFFHLPMAEKEKYSNLTEKKDFRFEGYGNDRILSEDQILDWNDRINLLVHPEDRRSLSLWPQTPLSFRNLLHEYSATCKTVVHDVLRAMATILNLDEEYFARKLGDKTIAYARYNYYPFCKRADSVFGMKPHSDGPVLTVLLPDDKVAGLQVLKDGQWIGVPTVPYTLVINIGDLTEIMTNGRFKSPMHRVVVDSEKERISLVVFFLPGQDEEIAPAEKIVGDGPLRYKKTTSEDYTNVFFQAFAERKRPIELMRI